MSDRVCVPPIKCQGIKTKLVPLIKANVRLGEDCTWHEPFMGSGVVGFNIAPEKALFSDKNPHLINFYNAIKDNIVTPNVVRSYLAKEGTLLLAEGEDHYYSIRERFNEKHNPLDFLFLSRACFNGMIRFNKKGFFNVPFCRKPNRFSAAYITKIVNQVDLLHKCVNCFDWRFECLPFEKAVEKANDKDFIYCDPPYFGRHVDYFDSWTEDDEHALFVALKNTNAKFMLSTWHGNKYRTNPMINLYWSRFQIITKEHFYHIGAKEENRNGMLEALVMNFKPLTNELPSLKIEQLQLCSQFGI